MTDSPQADEHGAAERGSAALVRYTEALLARPWLVVATTALAMLILGAGAVSIGVTNDHRVLFDERNPQLLAYQALEATYTESDTALIAVAPDEGAVFTREALGLIEALTESAWQTPYSIRVDSLTNYNHSESSGDDLIVGPLVQDAAALDDAAVARVEQIALNTPETVGRLVSADGRVGALAITFALPEDPDAAVIEITDHLHGVLDEYRSAYPQIGLHVTGDVLMNRAFADATRDDLEKLTPIVFVVIVLVTIAILRSLLATVAVVVTLMFTINTTMGFAGWVGTVFNPVNAGVPLIVLTIAVADSIHIVSSTMTGLARGLTRHEAIIRSIRDNAYPVLLTSVTTALAFLTLNASEAPPFRVLGNLVAFGVICAFVFSMTLLPAVLALLPLRGRERADWRFLDRLASFVIARRVTLIWTMSLLTVGVIAGALRLDFTDNWTTYFDDRYEFRRDTDFVVENLTGLESWEYSLDSGSEGGITDPDYLKAVDGFAEWLREQPEVSHVQAFTDVMKRLNKNMHGDDPAYYRLPDNGELAAQYLLLYELSLPFGNDLNDRLDVAKSATRLTAMARGGLTASQQREFDVRAQDWLLANAPDLASPATGFTITFAHLSQRNIESMLQATILAMGGISIILLLVLKSWRLGLISLVPNYIPAAMSFGVWGYLVGQVGLAGSVMTAVAFGIVVDDTTHFLTKYQRVRRAGQSAPDAVRATFAETGRALWTTTAILVAGFLVFASSGFEVSWTLGVLVAITLALALVADFLLLPPLLMTLDRRKT
ncbi:MAG: MMPL family transporter [Gammaproteobacteria bacterium]|nr:MMPL family transporter [Gammaproteobacteria bacterium]